MTKQATIMSLVAIVSLFALCNAFTPSPMTPITTPSSSRMLQALRSYVPDGLTEAEYKRIKESDRKKLGKNLGRLGPRGFQSRSLQGWQEAFDKGQTGHMFAPIQFKEKLRRGEMKPGDVPYMVREGGKWDNSDVPSGKRLPWSKRDKAYAAGGFRKEQSASILGNGPGFDWEGKQDRATRSKFRMPGFN